MAGYSGTPLPRKLGIKPGQRVVLLDAPDTFLPSIEPLPPDTDLLGRPEPPIDLAVAFADRGDRLRAHFATLEPLLAPAGILWAAWPKKTSGRPTDLVHSRVQATGLAAGLVDVKVCAIDETWSGLKFVRRVEDRR